MIARRLLLLLLLLCANGSLAAQPAMPSYHSHLEFLMASPGAHRVGLFGYGNPALLTYVKQPDFYFTWSDEGESYGNPGRWGIFTALPHFGFGLIRTDTPLGSVTDYRISGAFGDRSYSIGIGYGWSGGDTDLIQRENLITLSTLFRPNRYFSLGAIGYFTTRGGRTQGVADIGIRPFGNEKLTLFADYALHNDQKFNEGSWSWGGVVEALPGIRLFGRTFSDLKNPFDLTVITFGLELSFGRIGFNSQVNVRDERRRYNTYGIRIGAYDRNIFDTYLQRKTRYVNLNLYGSVKYQRYKFLDSSNTLIDLIETIHMAAEDPTVRGIAINMSGIRSSHTMMWELREKLKSFQESGKNVVIYIDGGGIREYHLASVADLIIMDPVSILTLEGFISGRTFLRGLLEKIGVGVEEWRFFEYKSAFETFSRDEMTEADREQRQRLLEDLYQLVKTDVYESRGITGEEFDKLVNETVIFLPGEAIEKGLIDTIARWTELGDILENFEGERKRLVSPWSLPARISPLDNHWSEPPKIAVIYAIGICAMDEGIKARSLVRDVNRARRDHNVKAIVFRVDSPGGDALASDIVAEALRKASNYKPVIITQGSVAASGGYWLSMYGDTIIAAPHTVTGSIGVIGGWFYDNGLKEKLGLSTDYVKIGRHADLGFGFNLPFLNIGLPDRNLTEEEFEKVTHLFDTMYYEFVQKVADGRGMEYDDVEPHSQGRVWSGNDAIRLGLVDLIGGLDDAIKIAKDKAGIPPHTKVTLVEYPEPGFIDPGMFAPRIFGVETTVEDPSIQYLKFRLRHNGLPLPIIPLDLTLINDRFYER